MERTIEAIIKESRYDTEVALSEVDRLSCTFNNGTDAVSGTSYILGIRVTDSRRSGFATSSDPGNWRKTLEMAEKIMRASEKLELEPELASESSFPEVKHSNELWQADDGEIIRMFQSMCKAKVTVVSATLERTKVSTTFANSNGTTAEQRNARLSANIEVSKNGISAFESKSSRKLFQPGKVSDRAVELCIESQNPSKVHTRRMPVLLDYFALSSLLESVFAPSILASTVQRNMSRLKNRVGEKVFSENLTIADVGNMGLNASRFDAEGTPTQRTVVVRDGELKTFLYDNYSAKKDGVESTGNCSSLSSRPSVSPSNLVIQPGGSTLEKTGLPGRYLYVHSIAGAHTANQVSGDFAVNANNAFIVKDGERTPVKHAMVSGNVFDLLNRIGSIGKDARQEGVVSSPRIVFKDVQVVA